MTAPEDITAAADLLRAHGYAVVTATQAKRWDSWLAEAHDRERAQHDENWRLMQEISLLEARCSELLQGRRPTWWREFRKRWRGDLSWLRNPVVGHEPLTDRKVAP